MDDRLSSLAAAGAAAAGSSLAPLATLAFFFFCDASAIGAGAGESFADFFGSLRVSAGLVVSVVSARFGIAFSGPRAQDLTARDTDCRERKRNDGPCLLHGRGATVSRSDLTLHLLPSDGGVGREGDSRAVPGGPSHTPRAPLYEAPIACQTRLGRTPMCLWAYFSPC